MVSILGQRIMEILNLLETNRLKFSKKLGISKQSIYDYVKGKSEPKADFYDLLEKKFPQINGDYIRTGKGKPFKNEYSTHSQTNIAEEEMKNYEKRIQDLELRIIDLEKLNETQTKLLNFYEEKYGTQKRKSIS